jgi:hypothetical protein
VRRPDPARERVGVDARGDAPPAGVTTSRSSTDCSREQIGQF